MAKKKKFSSLRRTMVIWFLILGLLPLTLVSWFSYQQAQSSLTRYAEENLKQTALFSINFIRNWFDYRLMDLKLQGGSHNNTILLEQLVKGLQISGKKLVDYVKSDDWEMRVDEENNDLVKFAHGYDYIYDLFLIDNHGNILFSVAHEADLGTSLMNGPYAETKFAQAVKNTLETDEDNFSGIERYSPSNDILAGFITTPMWDENGHKIGVFAIQLRLERIFSELNAKSLGESSLKHYLVDQNGLLQTPVDDDRWDDVLNRKININQLTVSSNVQSKVAGDVMASDEYIGASGNNVFGVDLPIKLANTNWILVSEVERDEVLAPAIKLWKQMLLLVVVSAIFLIFMAIYLARRITKPIVSLAEISMKVAEGELDQQVEINSNNEIGELARSFNHMLHMRQFHELALEKSAKEAQDSLMALADQKFAIDQHAIVAVTDAGGTITFVNEKFTEISGYRRDELIGQNHRILNSGFHETEFFTKMFKTISRGKVWKGEVCNQAKDGSLYWVDTTIVPFMGDNGPESYIAIRTDITERKKTEDALIEAKVEAEAAVHAKGEFLASMSHEIRTPMNGVLGMLNLLLNTKLNAEQEHRAKLAQSSAQSLLTLINDILDFSKVEAGKLDLEMIDFNLHEILGEFTEAMALQAQEKELELVLDLSAVDQTMVKGDPGRLRQIFTNLVSNAIKFTAAGEVVISVKLRDAGDQHWQLVATVTDTGIGIPEEKIDVLFESFSQADASTTRKYGGTGLGLTIVKKLCELMGGSVNVSSKPGKGSCFDITVLLEKSGQSKQVIPPVDMQSLNILVVDDNASNRQFLRRQFESWGVSVVEAKNGKQALAVCSERAQRLDQRTSDQAFFDLAFLDMGMPEMDGAELGKALKADIRFSTMKLVMMTSIASHSNAKRLADIGFSACFSKPATTADLLGAFAVLAEGANTLQADHRVEQNVSQAKDQKEEGRFESSIGQTTWPAHTRVLLVEDNSINQLVAKGLIKGFGLQIDIAENGIEALDLLRKPKSQTYSLILMDCEMPEMDGYEGTRQIRSGRAGPQNKEIPIIAMTANVMQGIREKCEAAGMNDYLAKPIEPNQLLAKLQEWLLDRHPDQEIVPSDKDETIREELVVWDKDAALKRLLGDEELLLTVIAAFLDDIPTRMDEIQQVLQEGDCEKIYRLAHSIKGIAGNIGGLCLQQQAALLEAVARENKLESAQKLLPDLQRISQQLTERLIQFQIEQSDRSLLQTSIITNEELISKLQDLEVRLQQNDYIEPEELSPLKRTSMKTEVQDLLTKLVEQIRQFRTDEAIKTLEKIAQLEGFDFQQDEEILEE